MTISPSSEYSIMCNICEESTDYAKASGVRMAESIFLENGWKKKKNIHICKECSQKEREVKK